MMLLTWLCWCGICRILSLLFSISFRTSVAAERGLVLQPRFCCSTLPWPTRIGCPAEHCLWVISMRPKLPCTLSSVCFSYPVCMFLLHDVCHLTLMLMAAIVQMGCGPTSSHLDSTRRSSHLPA